MISNRDRLMVTLGHMLEPDVTVRRLEVIMGTGRRRRFSDDDKARIVEEALLPGAVVSEVARRHGLMPQQVFTWRRQARSPSMSRAEAPQFVSALCASCKEQVLLPRYPPPVETIEIEVDGVTIRVGCGAPDWCVRHEEDSTTDDVRPGLIQISEHGITGVLRQW